MGEAFQRGIVRGFRRECVKQKENMRGKEGKKKWLEGAWNGHKVVGMTTEDKPRKYIVRNGKTWFSMGLEVWQETIPFGHPEYDSQEATFEFKPELYVGEQSWTWIPGFPPPDKSE